MLRNGLTRRSLLAAGAVVGATGRLVSAASAATGAAASSAGRRGFIDCHQHILPPHAPPILAKLMGGWSVEEAISGMNAAGIATGIVWPGSARQGTPQQISAITRKWNEFGAGLGRDHPGRFGLFAALPFPDVDACANEIDFAYDHLHADGVGIVTSYGSLWLGDRSFWPIYEKLNSRDAVVFVHPADAACCGPASMSYMTPPIDGPWIEWPMDTARTILSLMASGTLRRYPRIRFIFCHGGGVMPLLVKRVAGFKAWKYVGPEGLAAVFPDGGIENEFSQLHFECAQACSHTNMDALRSLVPDSQILFGTDFPFFPLTYGADQFRALHLPPQTQAEIGYGNAGRLMPRWG